MCNTLSHIYAPGQLQSANILHSFRHGLFFKIGYVCKIPQWGVGGGGGGMATWPKSIAL